MTDQGETRKFLSGNLVLAAYLSAIVICLIIASLSPGLSISSQISQGDAATVNELGDTIFRDSDPGEQPLNIAEVSASGAAEAGDLESGADTIQNASRNEVATIASDIPGSQDSALSLAEIDFDLGERSPSRSSARSVGDGQIEVRKSIVSGSKQLGSLNVTIDQNARLFVRGDDLKKLLASQESGSAQVSKIGPDGPVSFQRLRELGVNLRYDPIADHIVLQPG